MATIKTLTFSERLGGLEAKKDKTTFPNTAGYAVDTAGTHYVIKLTSGDKNAQLLASTTGKNFNVFNLKNAGHANDCTCANGKVYVATGGGNGTSNKYIICFDPETERQTTLSAESIPDVKDIASIEFIGGNNYILGKWTDCFLCELNGERFQFKKKFTLKDTGDSVYNFGNDAYHTAQGMCYHNGYLFKVFSKKVYSAKLKKNTILENIIVRYPLNIDNVKNNGKIAPDVIYRHNSKSSDRLKFEFESISHDDKNFYVAVDEEKSDKSGNDSLYRINLSK